MTQLTKDQLDGLKKLFSYEIPVGLISKFPSNAGDKANMPFVGHTAITAILNEQDPEWKWEPMARDQNGMPMLDANGGLWGYMTVHGKTLPEYGAAYTAIEPGDKTNKGREYTKQNVVDAHQNDVMSAIANFLCRGAMRFGIAIDMWAKVDLSLAKEPEGQALLSDSQLKELSIALSLVANKPGALKYMKSNIGTDEIDKLTESQFGQAMELIGSVPKLTDAMSAQAKDIFYKQIIDAKFIPVEILKALNFSDDGLTYAQKVEMTDYIKILKEQKA